MTTLIHDVAGLQDMELDLAGDYQLVNNIDASATSTWNGGDGFDPIGSSVNKFTGSFDGKGYAIDSLYIHRSGEGDCGLFGNVGDNVTIQNVSLTNIEVFGSGQTGYGALAGRVGENCTIKKCSASGVRTYGSSYVGGLVGLLGIGSTMQNCYATLPVTGNDGTIGGLIGVANTDSIIENCYATGAITHLDTFYPRAGGFVGLNWGIIRRCFAIGDIAGYNQNGGFVGYNGGTIENCYARGDVTSNDKVGGFCGQNVGTIDDSYSTGAPIGNEDVGGFCGINDDTITNCFWDTQTSGEATSDGGTGKTTTQMKTQSTFTDAGWNFTTIWDIDGVTNNGYPFLNPRAGFAQTAIIG